MEYQMPGAALDNWKSLNSAMLKASEAECQRLLSEEQGGKNRKNFVLRIHSRLNRLRAARERKELLRRRK